MPQISNYMSAGRDQMIKALKTPDFFSKNPDLNQLAGDVQECQANATAAAASGGCGCGGGPDVKAFIPCIEKVLVRVTQLQQENNDTAVGNFVACITALPVGTKSINLVIYATKDNGTSSHKYEFIA